MASKRSSSRKERYAGLQEPEDVLDFHGAGVLTSQAVKQQTEAFVRDAARRGLRRLRIVTGKGLHSKGAPRVQPQVRRTLTDLEKAGVVRAFQPERVDRGGDGAFRVDLA